jgi:starch synthase
MNILFAASELSPLAKTGGLGDVLAALPATLREQGHSVSVALPLYRSIREQCPDLKPTPVRLTVRLGSIDMVAAVWETTTPRGVRVYLIERDEFFDRSHLYGTEAGDYSDNAIRFIFFSKAVVALARYVTPLPQILHLHDWQTGLIPAFVRAGGLPYRTVFTIHNLAYQGSFSAFDFDRTNLPREYFSPPGVEFYGRLNLMKAGIVMAHQVTTVSPRYAQEIQSWQFGCSLENVLRSHKHKLTGIINGVDYHLWDPKTDPRLARNFSADKLDGKADCKRDILKKFDLAPTEAPLFAVISRLSGQKGLDLLAGSISEFIKRDIRFILLGSGDSFYQDLFLRLGHEHPEKIGVKIGYEETLAHQIEAGADFFLMPSHFEPCGLNQLYSLRYGAIPIVHDIGGLADSVENYNEATGHGTGFKFSPYGRDAFHDALEAALRVYKLKKKLEAIRRQAMKKVFSWDVSAAAYEKVYEKALKS